jgi:hypothetical protein
MDVHMSDCNATANQVRVIELRTIEPYPCHRAEYITSHPT